MNDAPPTIAELAREAEREALLRELVFANRVAAGVMRQGEADRRVAMMKEIARLLHVLDKGDHELRRAAAVLLLERRFQRSDNLGS